MVDGCISITGGDRLEMSERADALRRLAQLERIASDRLDEIHRLQTILADEQDKTARYSQQVDEMTDFLADYGLHWVGGSGPTNVSLYPRGPTDMRAFMQRICDLTAMAESGVAIEQVNGVSRPCEPKVRICLLDDGFQIDDGDIRPYSLPLSSDFFQDIMDGFFPVEFKSRFPEGVRLAIDDRRANDRFKGQGRRLVDSAHSERRQTWRTEIGEGAGQLKVKFADGKEAIVKIEPQTTMEAVKMMIEKELGFQNFRLAARPSDATLDGAKTVTELQLFPRGVLLLLQL
jgi:hypothetical protein